MYRRFLQNRILFDDSSSNFKPLEYVLVVCAVPVFPGETIMSSKSLLCILGASSHEMDLCQHEI